MDERRNGVARWKFNNNTYYGVHYGTCSADDDVRRAVLARDLVLLFLALQRCDKAGRQIEIRGSAGQRIR